MAKAKEVAVTADQFPTERPSYMTGDTMRGNEGVKASDVTIPRIDIIQDLSPQHKPSKAEYIEGAAVGMIFNTATNKLYGDSIFVIPVFYRKEWIIWRDQDHGGGFRGVFGTEAEAETAKAALEDAHLCEIVETPQQFCLLMDPASTADNVILEQAVLSMAGSKWKPNRKMNTMIQAAGGDRFERLFKLEVVEEQNSNGQDYLNWKVTQMGFVPELAFQAAEKFYDLIKSGAVDVKRNQDSPEAMDTPEAEDGEGPNFG